MLSVISLKYIKILKRITKIENKKRKITNRYDEVFDYLNNETEDFVNNVDNSFFENIDVDSLEEDERFLLCNMIRRKYSDSDYNKTDPESLKAKIDNL